jgi:transposase
MSAKRKRVVITTIEQKLEAVRRIKDGEILRNVAADFDVGISTVSDWVKSKSKLEEHSSKMPNRKTRKLSRMKNWMKPFICVSRNSEKRGLLCRGRLFKEERGVVTGRRVIYTAMEGHCSQKTLWEKKFKLKYQIFFVEICSVVLYL